MHFIKFEMGTEFLYQGSSLSAIRRSQNKASITNFDKINIVYKKCVK